MMEYRVIEYGSVEYEQLLNLRITVLLQPIGISAEYIEPENERDDTFIGLFDHAALVGGCILTPVDSAVVKLRQMAIAHSVQGKGLGRSLLFFAERQATLMKFSCILLNARSPVADFYLKCGYSVIGKPFEEVGISHLHMKKLLDDQY